MSVQIVPPGDGRSFGPGTRVKIEYGQSDDFVVFESELPPAWDGPPPHVHRIYDEAFYVLDGFVAFSCDGTIRDCVAGSFVFVPRGAVHGFANPSAAPARVLVITSPGAIRLVESFHEEMGRGGAPDPAAIAALFAQHDSEIVAPDPASPSANLP